MDNILAVQSLGGNAEERGRFDKDSAESFKRYRRVRLMWIRHSPGWRYHQRHRANSILRIPDRPHH